MERDSDKDMSWCYFTHKATQDDCAAQQREAISGTYSGMGEALPQPPADYVPQLCKRARKQ
jgi:hypothetical protein